MLDRASPSTPGPAPAGRLAVGALLLGLMLALAVSAALVAEAVHGRRQAVAQESERNELLARVLEDHATRSIEAVALAVSTLEDLLQRGAPVEGEALGSAMAQTLTNLPFLRALAVVGSDGKVLASSDRAEIGAALDLRAIGASPEAGRDRIGDFVAGRRLLDLAIGQASVAVPAGVGFIPLVRAVNPRVGQSPRYLVALLNPEAFSNFQQVMLGDPLAASALVTYSGRALASTASAGVPVGRDLSALPPFSRYLPRHEHATYVGPGMREGEQIAAFRVLRSRPLAVLVEKSRAQVVEAWMEQARWYLSAGAAGVVFILLMTAMAVRSLRAREAARQALDAALSEVIARERELSAIFGSVQELLFRTDAQGTLTFINVPWAQAGGQAQRAAVGTRLQDLVMPDSRDAVATLFAPEGQPRPRHALARLLGPDGQVRRFELTVVPLDAHGQPNGFAGSGVDVTEIHAVQSALQAQLAFTASLIDTNPLPISVHDAQGQCLRVNQAWEDFNGTLRDSTQLGPADLGALQLGSVLRNEARVAHRDGSMRDLLVTRSLVMGRDGQPAGIVTAFMDISEIRDAERATRVAREVAEEASRAKSEFIANVSHELRTPLQSILGFSELGRLRGRQHAALAAMFDDIHRAGQRMLALVNDLLAVAELDSAHRELVTPVVDLGPCLDAVVREFEPLLKSGRVALRVDLPPRPLRARVDPDQIGQVLRNVLGNAIRFSPPDSAVDLQASVGPAEEVTLEVRDRGPGIPPAELETIFEAFVQSSRTKDGSGGTGLGLTICRKILQACGGHIEARNRSGGGASFRISLPPPEANLPTPAAFMQK